MNATIASPDHISARENTVPLSMTDWPASTLFVYAMTRPNTPSSAAYVVSCRS